MDAFETFQRLGVAIAIGFFVGVERGWKHRAASEASRVAGLRTHTLIGLLGAVAGLIGAALGGIAFGAVALVFGLAWTFYKYLETTRDGDLSVTGLVGGLIVFGLGAYAMWGDMQIAAAAGVVVVAVLAFKEALHGWVRALSWEEIRSALFILAATLIALPLLPNRALDAFGAFNPRELWLLTIMLACASFASYVALRVFGQRAGLYLGTIAGALVSSTAVTLDLARRSKADHTPSLHGAAVASIANLVMFARVAGLAGLFSGALAQAMAAPLIAASVATCAAAAILAFAAHRKDDYAAKTPLQSPLDLGAVARLALVLGVIIVAARLAAHTWGNSGLVLFAATAGLVDVDAVTLAVSGMVREGLGAGEGAKAVLIAVGVDTLSKAGLAIFAGRRAFWLPYVGASLFALTAGVAAYVIFAGAF